MSDPASSKPRPRTALGADFIIPALGCGLAIYYLISSVDLIWEAKATGVIIGLVLLALCIAHCARLLLRIAKGEASFSLGTLADNDTFNRQRLGLAAMMALYVATIHWVGATLGLFFLLIGSMRLLGVTRVRTLIGTALVTAALVHLLLITLLGSKLPRGVLFNLLPTAFGGA